MKPRVSVVIPTYNYAQYISEAIESVLLAQSYRDFELIIIDDGSTDLTHQIVRKYAGALRYVHQDNRGASEARNRFCLGAVIEARQSVSTVSPGRLLPTSNARAVPTLVQSAKFCGGP